ncbi:MAG: urease accessory protein UreF [Acidimicrobiales bacterium]
MVPSAVALLLADGRFPAGGHAHSGGMEAAVTDGRVHDLATLHRFLGGRLATAGTVAATLAASVCLRPDEWERLEVEADARMASPVLRVTSRQQGRQLLRAATATLASVESSSPRQAPLSGVIARSGGLHLAVAMGLVAAAAGMGPEDAARWAAYDSVVGPATAAVRLLGLDPFAVHHVLAMLATQVDDVAGSASSSAASGSIPSPSAPMLDIGAEQHAREEMSLFAS